MSSGIEEHHRRRLAVLGTGTMGTALVESLVGLGHEVTVWNRTEANATRAVALGARRRDTIAEAVEIADCVFLSLSGPEAVAPVLEHVAAARPGLIAVDMTTMPPDESRRLATGQAGYVTCPVFAQPDQLARGRATIVTAGPAAMSDLLTQLWPTLGRWHHVGDDHGRATALKLLTNYLHLCAIGQLASALAAGRSWGLDDEIMTDWFGENPAVAPSARRRMEAMLSGGRETGYAQAHAVHALEMVLDAGAASRSWLVGAAEIAAAYGAGAPAGDVSMVIRSMDDRADP
jgi:3-hydroxyisobutyrate dehydrogenase-like beta-hydroxyacid dehydrogenase